MTYYTEHEKEEAFLEHKRRQEKLYNQGKLLIIIIAVMQVSSMLLQLVTGGSAFSLIINGALTVALCFGIRWVRYFLATTNAISLITNLIVLFAFIGTPAETPQLIQSRGVVFASLIFSIACCLFISVTLFFSKSVTEFLYAQRTS